jgi:hypothetical protein
LCSLLWLKESKRFHLNASGAVNHNRVREQ